MSRVLLSALLLPLGILVVVSSYQFAMVFIAPAAIALITGKFTWLVMILIIRVVFGHKVEDVLVKRVPHQTFARIMYVLFAIAGIQLARVIFDSYTLTFRRPS